MRLVALVVFCESHVDNCCLRAFKGAWCHGLVVALIIPVPVFFSTTFTILARTWWFSSWRSLTSPWVILLLSRSSGLVSHVDRFHSRTLSFGTKEFLRLFEGCFQVKSQREPNVGVGGPCRDQRSTEMLRHAVCQHCNLTTFLQSCSSKDLNLLVEVVIDSFFSLQFSVLDLNDWFDEVPVEPCDHFSFDHIEGDVRHTRHNSLTEPIHSTIFEVEDQFLDFLFVVGDVVVNQLEHGEPWLNLHFWRVTFETRD